MTVFAAARVWHTYFFSDDNNNDNKIALNRALGAQWMLNTLFQHFNTEYCMYTNRGIDMDIMYKHTHSYRCIRWNILHSRHGASDTRLVVCARANLCKWDSLQRSDGYIFFDISIWRYIRDIWLKYFSGSGHSSEQVGDSASEYSRKIYNQQNDKRFC